MKSRQYRSIRGLASVLKRWHYWVAAGLLGVMFGLAYWAMTGNSLTMDEQAHIPAGYSYVQYGDYRLNPEHPPLVKDIAGFPLLALMPEFPDTLPLWTTDVNAQWEAGKYFLFHLGNDADALIYWARLPILVITIVFGIWLYRFLLPRYGRAVALVTTGLFAFSPTFLAHSTLVTTDVAASMAFFLVLVAFAGFIRHLDGRHFWWLVGAMTLAQLVKFSALVVLAFLFVVAILVAVYSKRPATLAERMKAYVGRYVLAGVVSVAAVWAAYAPHVWAMPQSVQDRLISASIWTPGFSGLATWLTQINDVAVFKPLAQYILGILMVFGRVGGGNITFFNGEVANESFFWYFPEVFALKTQVAFLLVLFALVAYLVRRAWLARSRAWFTQLVDHARRHSFEWLLGGFAVFYMAVAMSGNLNLGIRHIMPVYLPLFVLVAIGAVRYGRLLMHKRFGRLGVPVAASVLALWYAASPISVAPSFLSYFNEVIGGPANAANYFTDSSVDWGQDLKRLKAYLEQNPQIKHLALDYFGGSVPEYYFCERLLGSDGKPVPRPDGYDCSKSKVEVWHVDYGRYPGQYIAVSATHLQNDRFFAEKDQREGFEYLRAMEPIAKIGSSIYLYKLY